MKSLFPYLQYFLPKHALSVCAGKLAQTRVPALKNTLIEKFIRSYGVNMKEALIEDPTYYENFNAFFIRHLKPALRPIAPEQESIASPVDGTIAEIGRIHQDNRLLQAKGFYYDLTSLLGGDTALAALFKGGDFATFYLAPHNYHRVHMPLAGELKQSLFVPGRLFSVNHMTSQMIPQLYSRNERLITLFDTAAGPMALIFVGALIVGSIQTTWMDQPCRSNKIQYYQHDRLSLAKGAEVGYFRLGSTVIALFAKDRVSWGHDHKAGSIVNFGQKIGSAR
ncbi:MAG TPA: archaetidylserine decarboxylase [Gammaproteobacteria bacterium]|jgi:phosphatidylserine decarboxylase|nr:archaetidylserine decarboxylase [Gammaproteobacteria bacterium]